MAGFDVVGVDIEPQPHYRGDWFLQADALTYVARHGTDYDAIHASPPCQAFCALKHLTKKQHPDLVAVTRERLRATGKPFVIENVPGAPLLEPAMLCGTMFGLQTDCGAQLRRHRLFETNWPLRVDLKCAHYKSARPATISVHGHSGGSSWRDSTQHRTICVNGTGNTTSGGMVIGVYGERPHNEQGAHQRRVISVHGNSARERSACKRTISITGSTPQTNVERNVVRECFPVSAARTAMGIEWMTMAELSQAIPPAYTFYIGQQLIAQL